MNLLISKIERYLSAAEAAMMVVANVALMMTMLVVVADVFMRYVFNAPFAWAYQLIQYNLLAALYFFAISETQKRRENIAVHVLENLLPARGRALLDAFVSLLILVFAIALFYVAVPMLTKSVVRSEYVPGLINWQKWPTYTIFVAGTAVFIVRIVMDMIHALQDRDPETHREPAAP